jgi:hypothetical protein
VQYKGWKGGNGLGYNKGGGNGIWMVRTLDGRVKVRVIGVGF